MVYHTIMKYILVTNVILYFQMTGFLDYVFVKDTLTAFLSEVYLLEAHWNKNCFLNPVRLQLTQLIDLSVIGPLNLGHFPLSKCVVIGLNLALH